MAVKDEFADVPEVKSKAPVAPIPAVSAESQESFAATNNPINDRAYMAILTELQGYHTELIKMGDIENPVIAGQYQGKIRLGANRLFAYMNAYIDLQADLNEEYSIKRQYLYETQLKLGKSPSAADKHAGEMTRVLSANMAVAKLRVDQIRNEYERYNGIAIYLASRMKEFNTERMMG